MNLMGLLDSNEPKSIDNMLEPISEEEKIALIPIFEKIILDTMEQGAKDRTTLQETAYAHSGFYY